MKYQRVFAILFGGLVLLTGCATAPYETPYQKHTRRGYEYLQGAPMYLTNFMAAEREFKEAVRLNPDEPQAYYNLAWAYEVIESYGSAASVYREAVRLRPDDPKAHYKLAMAYQGHAFQRGTKDWQKFIDQRGTKDWQKLIDQAVAEFREAIRLKPHFAEAHLKLGGLLARMSYEETGIEYKGAVRGSGAGVIKEYRYKPSEEAEKEYREAVRVAPDYVWAQEALARYLDQFGRRKEARVYWERALKLMNDPYWVKEIKKRLAEPR